MTSSGFIPFDEPYKIEMPIEADARELAEDRAEEIAESILAIAAPALKRGRCDFKIDRPRKGRFKLELAEKDLCAELTGTLTEGVSRRGGRFNYIVESNGHFPEVTGAISNAPLIKKWAIYFSVVFFTTLLFFILLFILVTTGWLVLSKWYLVLIGFLSFVIGGGIGNIVARLIIQKKLKKALTTSYQALDRWIDVMNTIDTYLSDQSASR